MEKLSKSTPAPTPMCIMCNSNYTQRWRGATALYFLKSVSLVIQKGPSATILEFPYKTKRLRKYNVKSDK